MASCASAIMIGNEPILSEQPDWVQNFLGWRETQYDKEGNDRFFYEGFSKRDPIAVAKDKRISWDYENAYLEAEMMAKRHLTEQIIVLIESEHKDLISEKDGKLKEEIERITKSVSSSVIHGWVYEKKYSETWEQTIRGKKISSTHLWLLFSVPITEFQAAQERARSKIDEYDKERKAAIDEKNKLELEKRKIEETMAEQQKMMTNYSLEFVKIENSLNNNLFDVKQLDKKRDELLSLLSFLDDLDLLKTRNDKARLEYDALKENINNLLNHFSYAERHNRLIDSLTAQLANSNARLDELRQMQSRQGYSLQTQTIIISFPQKPYETEIPSKNIFVANDMVSNHDFISFCNINGISNFTKAESGLYNRVVSVTWNNAARFCNWLSKLYGLEPCYDEINGKIIAYNNKNNGYRLPEEHEILAILNTEYELIKEDIGFWSSSGFPQEYISYALIGETGQSIDKLAKQSFDESTSDSGIGFRVVRNAK